MCLTQWFSEGQQQGETEGGGDLGFYWGSAFLMLLLCSSDTWGSPETCIKRAVTLLSFNSLQTRDNPFPHLSGGSAVSLIYHTSFTWGYPFGLIIQRGFAKKPVSPASLARKLGRELSWSQPSGQETSPVAPVDPGQKAVYNQRRAKGEKRS